MKSITAYFSTVVLIAVLITACIIPSYAEETKAQAEAYYKLGQTYYDQGKYKEAEDMFQKSVNILSRIQVRTEANTPSAKIVETPREERRATPPLYERVASSSLRHEYVIGDDDELHISVWQNPDLDSDVVVRLDGMMSFPLIGDIPASGLTISQLTRDVMRALTEFVKEPQVSISIRKIGGKRVIILGQVSSPGVISVGGAMKVMDAIGMSGGFTRDAVPSSTIIIRGGLSGAKAKKLNLSKVFKGDLTDNIDLQSQDIIFVPRKFISDVNYFLEQILQPLSQGVYVSQEAAIYGIGQGASATKKGN